MAIGIGTALLAGKTLFSAGKAIKGAVMANKAQGAPMVDPRKERMVNMTRRMLRARRTGTSDFAARRRAEAAGTRFARKFAMSGGRSTAALRDLMSSMQENISNKAAQEMLGLVPHVMQGETELEKRKMDIQNKEQLWKRTKGQALQNVGEKNLWAGMEKLEDEFAGSDPLAGGAMKDALNEGEA
jgi:hypothetical protein